MVRVVMLNDERARMDFVVDALSSVAGLARKDAVAVMMRAHLKGRAGLAILPPERATVMIDELASHARTSGQSLKCVMEKE
ncbi:MAG: ATP-dependent Clp protease adaptor ClpS [Hyphomicrobiaceae bacterium]